MKVRTYVHLKPTHCKLRDCYQVTLCDMGVSLDSKTHQLFICSAVLAHVHIVYWYLSLYFFPIPIHICPLLIFHLLVSSLLSTLSDHMQNIADPALSKAH